MAQHERRNDAAEQRPRLPAAVADAQEGWMDEPGWTGALHRLDDEADAANHRRIVLQRSPDAETAQHRVVPGNGPLHGLPIGDIADDNLQMLMADGEFARRADEG